MGLILGWGREVHPVGGGGVLKAIKAKFAIVRLVTIGTVPKAMVKDTDAHCFFGGAV
jgi:hypothetical protein